MTDRKTVQTVALGLVIIVIVATLGYLLLMLKVADSDTEFDPALLVVLSNIAIGALGGLTGLLASTKSVDPEAISDRAKADALAEVEALGPNTLGQGD